MLLYFCIGLADKNETLEAIWEYTERRSEILSKIAEKNENLYEFERRLNETG